MNTERCERWSVVGGVEWPAADLFFSYEAPYIAMVRMQFANTVRGSQRDLVLRFRGVIALRYESESTGLVPLPEPPRFTTGEWSGHTFPLLLVQQSLWLAEHHAHNSVESTDRHHFALVSMNDLLHILALPTVEASWVEARDA
jgi:hypothetical protein